MSLEQLLAINPDMILFISADGVSDEVANTLVQSMSKIPQLDAVNNNRVGALTGFNLMGVGPGIIDLVSQIKQEGNRLWGSP
jgi:ABC-type Fe3+-hydroxamate transport system substrate-binding protein